MADIHELAKSLQKLDDQMVTCMKCGMCQAVCPLYAETGREADVARGKIALVENLAGEILHDPQAVKERLDRCLLCGSCAASCPSGVKVLDIFLQARAVITGYLGLSPAKKAIFRGMLANPKLFNAVLDLAPKFQNLFTKPVNDTLGSSCARFMSPLLGDRHFLPLAKTSWHKQTGEVNTPRGESGIKIAFYPGCLVDKIYPPVAEAAFKVLGHHGVGLYMPARQVCCGIPALSSGDRKTFDRLVRDNLRLFSDQDVDYLLTPCATCTATIKKIWPLMARDYPHQEQEKIKTLAEKTRDLTEFVASTFSPSSEDRPVSDIRRATYHDPCHLKKSLDVSREPRSLISNSPGFELVEMADADRCCGMGGSFNLQHYDLSKRIGEKKLQSILNTYADVVATCCPACMMQITDLLSRAGASMEVRHVIELYAQGLASGADQT
ncbi:MAG: (Fe-S)-binding protein [Desulfovermiculus sp.]